jgi:hypothetical protein
MSRNLELLKEEKEMRKEVGKEKDSQVTDSPEGHG